jgi:predicted  nucleic acid-binding Zn-ribbon protein
MPGQTTLLYRLQQIDLAIDAKTTRYNAIKTTLTADDRVVRAEAALKATNDALTPVQTRARDLDLEVKSLAGKIKATEDRLYGGKVHNPKELGDMQNEIGSLKKRMSQLEDEQLETMLLIEEKQAAVVTAKSDLAAVQQQSSNDHAALIDEQSVIKREVADLTGKRKEAASHVEAALLKRYDDLRPKKRGLVVAPLKEDSCGTCGVEQTSVIAQQVRQGQQVVLCANCGRILATP